METYLEYGALGVAYLINGGAIALVWKVFDKSSRQIDTVAGALAQSAAAQHAMATALTSMVREVESLGDVQKDQRFDVMARFEAKFDAFRRDIRKEVREALHDA